MEDCFFVKLNGVYYPESFEEYPTLIADPGWRENSINIAFLHDEHPRNQMVADLTQRIRFRKWPGAFRSA